MLAVLVELWFDGLMAGLISILLHMLADLVSDSGIGLLWSERLILYVTVVCLVPVGMVVIWLRFCLGLVAGWVWFLLCYDDN
jgi:hypothetical protein